MSESYAVPLRKFKLVFLGILCTLVQQGFIPLCLLTSFAGEQSGMQAFA